MKRCAIAVLLLAVSIPAAPAEAAYQHGADLLSESPARREQADALTSRVDISGNGRYVVFDTRARNLFADDDPDPPDASRLGALFRRDLLTGSLEPVADGDLQPVTGGAIKIGAHNPSISADGRWIAFSTGAKLSAIDSNVNVDVYVRDMAKPVDDPAAYELVSARDGDDGPATYTTGGAAATPPGSEVTAGAAISADGRVIAFRTRVDSDLPNREPGATTAGQVLVRDRAARRTILVTRTIADGEPAGGATSSPVSISADGSTVVWNGVNADAQAPFLGGEFTSQNYYMWRRIADGPAAPTRRITGAIDPEDPSCAPGSSVDPGNQVSEGPCYGPLTLPEDTPAGSIAGQLPALSADGRQIAFLAGPGLRPDPVSGTLLDLFVTDMTDGVTRKAGTVQLTREAGSNDLPIQSLAITADGRKIAFVSERAVFSLPSPRLVSPIPVHEGPVGELYVVDLATMEMERVLRGQDGDSIDGSVSGSVGAMAVSDDASRIAFVSAATNLFFGDSNSVSDAFVVSSVDPNADLMRAASEPPFPEIGPPREGAARSAPSLQLKVKRRGKSLLLTVRVPGPGNVSARLQGRIRKRLTTVASGHARAKRAGQKRLPVRPARRYRRTGQIRARLVVTFTPAGGGSRIKARRSLNW